MSHKLSVTFKGESSKKEESSTDSNKKAESSTKAKEDNSSRKWFQGANTPKTWNPSDTFNRKKVNTETCDFFCIFPDHMLDI